MKNNLNMATSSDSHFYRERLAEKDLVQDHREGPLHGVKGQSEKEPSCYPAVRVGAGSSVKDDLVEASPGELWSLLRALQESDQSKGNTRTTTRLGKWML